MKNNMKPTTTLTSNFVRELLPSVTTKPGVYYMKDKKGNILYIGKAKNLKKRLQSYASSERHNHRIQKMISETFSIDYTITDHEASALLLEANMIKSKKPKFNILMRDDKTYPHILIRNNHEWAQLLKSRGNKVISVLGSFDNIELAKSSVDFLVAWDSLHHSSNILKTLNYI